MNILIRVAVIFVFFSLPACCPHCPKEYVKVNVCPIDDCFGYSLLSNSDDTFIHFRPREPSELMLIRITNVCYSQSSYFIIDGNVMDLQTLAPLKGARLRVGFLTFDETNPVMRLVTLSSSVTDSDGHFSISDSMRKGLSLLVDHSEKSATLTYYIDKLFLCK